MVHHTGGPSQPADEIGPSTSMEAETEGRGGKVMWRKGSSESSWMLRPMPFWVVVVIAVPHPGLVVWYPVPNHIDISCLAMVILDWKPSFTDM